MSEPRFSEPEVELPKGHDDWVQYFKDMREQTLISRGKLALDGGDPESDSDPAESFAHVTVTTPAREMQEGWPNVISTWRKRALDADGRVKVGYAQAHHDTTHYKNGNVNSEAHEEDTWWINAFKDGKYITVSYTYKDGNTIHAVRQVRGALANLSDKEMQAVIKGV